MRVEFDMTVTVNGLPLHPLVVHATVVALPVTALVALGYCVPRWRDRLRWPLLVLGLVSAALVWITVRSGHSLDNSRFATATGLLAVRIAHHRSLGHKLEILTWVLAGLIVLAAWLHHRPGIVRYGLAVLLAAGAVAVVVLTVMTGEAGARAAWGQ